MRKRRLNVEWLESRIAPTTYNLHRGDNLQNAIHLAQPGDSILLDPGAVFSGPIILEAKPNPTQQWITIASNNFPLNSGVRVSPNDAPSMAYIQASSFFTAIQTDPGANCYYLRGLNIQPVNAQAVVDTLVLIGDGSANQKPASTLPNNIQLDQCYIHGLDGQSIKRGVALNDGGVGSKTGVLNSYVANFKSTGQDTQAIAGWNGSGPFAIQNNYLEGAGENVLFGGAYSYIQKIPSNITITNNTFSKPLSWNPADPSYAGTNWSVKNLLELKNAQNVTIDSNTFQNNWVSSQDGHSLLITPRGAQDGGSWAGVQNVAFTHNTVQNTAQGFNILGSDDSSASLVASNILIQDNIFNNVGGQVFTVQVGLNGGTRGLVIDHNTITSAYTDLVVNPVHYGFQFTNNLMPQGTYGMLVNGLGIGPGPLAQAFPDGIITNNVIVGGSAADYPAGNFFPATFTQAATLYPWAGARNVTNGNKPWTATGVNFTATVGTPFSGIVATIQNADTVGGIGAYTAGITWGDGSTSVGTIMDQGGGIFAVNGTHTYASPNSYTVSTSIQHPQGVVASATVTCIATVTTAPWTASGVNFQATAGSPFTGTVATIQNADTVGGIAAYTATINWGDTTTSTGVITDQGNKVFAVGGTHTYTTANSYTVTTSIQHPQGVVASATATCTATVISPAWTASGVNFQVMLGTLFSGMVAVIQSADTVGGIGAYTATITWGDGKSSAGTIADQGNAVFAVNGTHAYPAPGTYTVSVDIEHPAGVVASATTTSTATVLSGSWTATGVNFTATAGSPFTGAVAMIQNADTVGGIGAYTATISWGDGRSSAGTITDQGNRVFAVSGTHVYSVPSSYFVSVNIQHPQGIVASATTNSTASVVASGWTANGVNFQATAGSPFTGTVATIQNADTVGGIGAYTATINWGDTTTSTGVITDQGNKVFAVGGTHTYATANSYTVTTSIQHPQGVVASATATGTATVVAAPWTASGVNFQATAGSPFTGTVATIQNADTVGGIAAYTATINWGDTTTSTGVITDQGNKVFAVGGTHTYATANSYTVTTSIQHPQGVVASATATCTATVVAAPWTASGVNFQATAGSPFTGTVATIQNADTVGGVGAYTATINWGDTTTSTGVITDQGNKVFAVGGTHTYATANSYTVTTSIQHPQGVVASATATCTATVISPAWTASGVNFQATAGSPFTGTVATIQNADTVGGIGAYTATINWGDTTTSTGVITDQGNKVFAVGGTHTYATANSYTVTTSIQHPQGVVASATATSTATVVAAPWTASGVNFQATAGSPFTGTVATIQNADTVGGIGAYTATINWGDTTTSTGVISDQGNKVFAVGGTHTYTTANSYTVTTSIQHPQGVVASATATCTATVVAAPWTASGVNFQATAGSPFTGTVATIQNADTVGGIAAYTATINWGDTTTSTGVITDQGNKVFAVGGTHTYATANSYTVSIAIQHPKGVVANATVTCTATVVSTSWTASGVNFQATAGSPFTGTVATIQNADTVGGIAAYTATINWGDTTTSTGVITDQGNKVFAVGGTHTYATANSYTVTTSIQHPQGVVASATATCTATVVAAPWTASGVNFQATAGSPFTGTVATIQNADTVGGIAAYTATINWGDTTTSTGVITDQGNKVFAVGGTHTYATANSYTVSIAIQHPKGVVANATVTCTATVVSTSWTASGVNFQATAGSPFTGTVATIQNADTVGGIAAYTATINWGDTTTSTGVITDQGNKVFAVGGTHTYATANSYTVTTSIQHPHGVVASATATGTATVVSTSWTATGVNFAAVAGAPFTGTVATIQNADTVGGISAYTATINWGDGNTSTGTIADQGNKVFAVSGTHTYLFATSYPVSIAIQHPQGVVASANPTCTATVSNLGAIVQKTQVGGLGFWNSTHGQALINSFNGGSTATLLATWLATNFPNLYGANASNRNLTGKTNAQVAALYQSLLASTLYLDAEVLVTALNIYATTQSLGGSAGQTYGFTITSNGLGASSWTVGSFGSAFGVPSNTVLNVYTLLTVANLTAVNGVPWGNLGSLSSAAFLVFFTLNEQGGVS